VGLDTSTSPVERVLAIRGELSSITGDAPIRMLDEFVAHGDDGAKRISVTFTQRAVGGSPGRAE